MASVVDTNEILLNSKRYKIAGPVRKTLVSIAAPRFTIGDTQRGADPRASILTQNDFRGGIGWNRGLDASTIDRAWWSTCQLRYKGHVLLARKPTTASTSISSADGGGSVAGEVVAVGGFDSQIYAIFGTSVHIYNEPSDNWTSSKDTLVNPTAELINFHYSGADYLIFARGDSGYTHLTGTTFTDMDASGDASRTVDYFAIWHGSLWGIDSTNRLKNWASGPTANPTEKALPGGKIPLPDGYVTSLFVYRDAAGSPVLYAGTKVGLWVYDESNNRWEETELRLPFHPESGSGAVVWRDSIYYPAGNALYKYQTGSNSAVVSLVGYDRDHGIPETYTGQTLKLIGTHNDLLALVNADIDVSYTVFATGRQGSGFGGASTVVSGTGTSSILGWNEGAWETKWTAGNNTGLKAGHVGSETGTYRLWFGVGDKLAFIDLSPDVINPDQISGYEYDATTDGILETPWFDGGDSAGNKTAVTLRAVTSGCTSDVTIKVEFATAFSESYTTLGTITSNGTTTYEFASGAGVEFASIKFKVTLATNTTASSPDLNMLELRWREKLPPKFGFSVNIDTAQAFKGQTPKQMMDSITTVINTNTLVAFTYKDDDSDRTYNVDLVSASGFEFTGLDERGQIQLQLVEL
jgi:hypothetical protein